MKGAEQSAGVGGRTGCSAEVIPLMSAPRFFMLAAFFGAMIASSRFARADFPLPLWAYGTEPATRAAADLPGGGPVLKRLFNSDAPLHLTGSTLTFTSTQTRDPYAPADWYPNEHPPVPELVAYGQERRRRSVRALPPCGWLRTSRKRQHPRVVR
jgi:hypothetical protein